MTKIKETVMINAGQDYRKWNPHKLILGFQNRAMPLQDSLATSSMAKRIIT
jgi:hypothetical protein